MSILLNDDGYPTAAALEAIKNEADPAEALNRLKATWSPRYGSVSEKLSAAERQVSESEPGAKLLRFATGGWSGNEDALDAFGENFVAYSLSWRMSAAGGLRIFEVPEIAP